MDMGNLKITMVGTTGTGKTTFNAGIYQKLIQNQIEGFCLRPRQQQANSEPIGTADIENALRQIEIFRQDYKRMAEQKQFPGGTVKLQNWKLDFYHHEHKLSTIEWIDYAGGILQEFSNKNTQLGPLINTITDSDALMCFIDADKLTSIENLEEASEYSGASVIKTLLTELNRTAPSTDLTIALVLTKCDGIARRYRSGGNFTSLLNRCERLFEDMEEIFERQRGWNCAIVPVSAIGLGKAERINQGGENSDFLSSDNLPDTSDAQSKEGFKIIGYPDAYNVEAPFFYCIEHIVSARLNRGDINGIALKVWQHQEYLKEQKKRIFRNENVRTPYNSEQDYSRDKRELEWITESLNKWRHLSSQGIRSLTPVRSWDADNKTESRFKLIFGGR